MPIWLGNSLSSSFLFQNDSSLCQADIKLAGTAVKTVVYLYCIQIYYTRIFKFCLFVWEKISLWIPFWPGIYYIDQEILKYVVVLLHLLS